jgi:putative transposase
MSSQRKDILALISEAHSNGARLKAACGILGLSVRTLQRWQKAESLVDGRLEPSTKPSNKLSEEEREEILSVSNEPRFANLGPNKMMADEGCYLASESSFYRVLKEARQLAHRQQSRVPRAVSRPKALVATGPNQVYSWDITYLKTTVKGIYFYLYLMLDIYSRKIVGWQIHDCEDSGFAADLMVYVCEQEGIEKNQVTLHSDNGSPMKGATMLATLDKLGVVPSFSRPSVSDDNPYSESLFRTLKYRPEYPKNPFATLEQARAWVEGFVVWYNNEHLHSAIKYVTPAARHRGEDPQILAKRHDVYRQAKAKNPLRWSQDTRNWDPITEVCLNPDKSNQRKTADIGTAA